MCQPVHAVKTELNNNNPKTVSGLNRYRYFKKIRKDGFGKYQIVPSTRRLAIKHHCLECVGFDLKEVKLCTEMGCPLYPYRLGDLPAPLKPHNRNSAIRNFCMECTSGDTDYIAECPSELCPLYPYRLSGNQTDYSTLIESDTLQDLP